MCLFVWHLHQSQATATEGDSSVAQQLSELLLHLSLYRSLDSGGPGHRAQDGEMLGTPGCPRPGLKAGSTAGALQAGAGGILLPSPPPPQAAQVSTVNTRLAARPRTTQAVRAPGGRQTPRLPRVKAEQVSRPGPWPLSTWASAAWTGRITGKCKARLRVVRTPAIMQKKKIKLLLGRMLGYRFFSLFSSLLASSKAPCTCPDGRD